MKVFFAFLVSLVIFSSFKNSVLAAESTSYNLRSQTPTDELIIERSASLKKSNPVTSEATEERRDPRLERLKSFLGKYKSPLLSYADYIIIIADNNKMPWNLVVAIAGVESTFCKVIPPKSHNCWGWKNGRHFFANYQVAIEKVTKTLKINYFDRGLTTPEAIGRIYAPPTPSWGKKVRYFMNQLENWPYSQSPQLPIFI